MPKTLRNRRIIICSHCLLNQNSVVDNLERSSDSYRNIVRVILDESVSIIQLPCPELIYLGSSRKPKTREDYDTKEFRKICSEIAASYKKTILEYLDNAYSILGIVGIKESPSCDISGYRGILMDEIFNSLEASGIKLRNIDIPTTYIEGLKSNFLNDFKKFIRGD